MMLAVEVLLVVVVVAAAVVVIDVVLVVLELVLVVVDDVVAASKKSKFLPSPPTTLLSPLLPLERESPMTRQRRRSRREAMAMRRQCWRRTPEINEGQAWDLRRWVW